MSNPNQNKPDPHKKYVFFIDKKQYDTEKPMLTARQILVDYAKVDPDKKTLVLKEGNDIHEYKPDEEITMKEGMHFTLFDNEVTPTS